MSKRTVDPSGVRLAEITVSTSTAAMPGCERRAGIISRPESSAAGQDRPGVISVSGQTTTSSPRTTPSATSRTMNAPSDPVSSTEPVRPVAALLPVK
jgi:hypothetical protein